MYKNKIIDIWKNKIPNMVKSGIISYESQLQAEFYHQLKISLDESYKIFIEPVIYLEKSALHKTKPDIVITKNKDVACIMELKFKPYEEPKFIHDMDKLIFFEEQSKNNAEIPLIYEPSHLDNFKRVNYKLNADILYCYILFGRKNCSAFNLETKKKPQNFLFLIGYIESPEHIVCEEKTDIIENKF